MSASSATPENAAASDRTMAVEAPRAVLRLFAAARQAAGTGRVEMSGPTVGAVLEQARVAYGPQFSAVLATCRVWCNGEPADLTTPLRDGDEVAALPPVSGGAGLSTCP
jgi:molybdopterin synthase sulfur carrier subunit